MASSILIEKGVPLAENRGSTGTKYPFRDMDVGDSFVAKLADSKSTTMEGFRNALLTCAKNSIGPRKIATRKLEDGSGFRVWRTA